jgi:hypothetical protein
VREDVDNVICAGLLIERKSNGSSQSRCGNRRFFITSSWAGCYGAKLKRLNSCGLNHHELDVRFGSLADIFTDSSSMSALRRIADTDFRSRIAKFVNLDALVA